MSSALLQLSLCAATFIQLTSSQSTYDVIQQGNADGSSCGHTDQVLEQLLELNYQLQRDVAEIKANMSQLQRDIAEVIVSSSQQTEVKRTLVQCLPLFQKTGPLSYYGRKALRCSGGSGFQVPPSVLSPPCGSASAPLQLLRLHSNNVTGARCVWKRINVHHGCVFNSLMKTNNTQDTVQHPKTASPLSKWREL